MTSSSFDAAPRGDVIIPGKPCIVICQHALTRDCLVQCLKEAFPDRPTRGYETIAEWYEMHRGESEFIILCNFKNSRIKQVIEHDISDIIHLVPDTKIAVVADAPRLDHANSAIRAGARGYMSANYNLNTLCAVIDLIAAGAIYISPDCLELSGESSPSGKLAAASNIPKLTRRQIEIAELIRQGVNRKIIADTLSISTSTVNVHVFEIMKRLNITSYRDLKYSSKFSAFA
ncbi:hypothetical protein C5L14_29785 [Labrys okinawensis]|uniref:HTH luxR-type domain-containing protein n=1 Tax=Labrys okinawensis TaxID=346911 RepID=A0A2S9Q3J5_9HYPH|nr:response regulator transcription factor [Labrys okinawensis]PRH83895.1 hypothetical protein C5L14_29785 [Labrys okinawensis]